MKLTIIFLFILNIHADPFFDITEDEKIMQSFASIPNEPSLKSECNEAKNFPQKLLLSRIFFLKKILKQQSDESLKRFAKEAREHHLTRDEAVSIIGHTSGEMSLHLNHRETSHDDDQYDPVSIQDQSQLLNTALSKMNNYTGCVVRGVDFSFRGGYLPLKEAEAREKAMNEKRDKYLSQYRSDDGLVTDPAFVSTSKANNLIQMDPMGHQDGNIQFVIASCCGKDISKFSASGSEVLFPQNTQFEVLNVKVIEHHYRRAYTPVTYIRLREIPQPSKSCDPSNCKKIQCPDAETEKILKEKWFCAYFPDETCPRPDENSPQKVYALPAAE